MNRLFYDAVAPNARFPELATVDYAPLSELNANVHEFEAVNFGSARWWKCSSRTISEPA